MQRLIGLLAALIMTMSAGIPSAHAQAASPSPFAGTWAMRLGERNLFVITITPTSDGFTGTFDRPEHYSSTNTIFANITGKLRDDRIVRARADGSALHFTVRNSQDATDEDDYLMTVSGDQGTLALDGLPASIVVEPMRLVRVSAQAKVATDWQPNRIYCANDSDTPSNEMKAIFDEDQRVRESQHVDWKTVGGTDAQRRERTRKLLAAGALHTGKDFEEAAFVFQHGDKPDDYLLAHALAMIAVARGDPTAIWIASATLDRYLENIGQKQIFGTQFSRNAKGVWTQEPYDRDLVSDAMREQLGVPGQATQAKQLKAYQEQK